MAEYNVVDMGAAFPHRIKVTASDPRGALKKLFPEIEVKRDRMGDLIVTNDREYEFHFRQVAKEKVLPLPEKLKDIMKKNGLTQDAFAKKIGSTPNSVSNWMTGKTIPRESIIANIAFTFGEDVRELSRIARGGQNNEK